MADLYNIITYNKELFAYINNENEVKNHLPSDSAGEGAWHLMTWGQFPGPTWEEERTSTSKLSSDLHIYTRADVILVFLNSI